MRVERIERIEDERLSDYDNVREAELVKKRGVFIAESRLVVATLLERSRFVARSVLLSEKRLASMMPLLETLDDTVPVYVAPQAVLDAVIGFSVHRGVLASGTRAEPDDVPALLEGTPRTIVVLEGVNNHDNIGGIFRSAAALGAGAVLLDPRCADPLYRKSIRVSLGAALTVPFARADDWPGTLATLARAGYTTVALTPRADATPLDRVASPSGRFALVVGTEGEGLTEEAMEQCTLRARIPITDAVDSLNVATACAIALYATRRAEAGETPSVAPPPSD